MIFSIGGVPEHYNFPWHIIQRYQLTQPYPFNFVWHSYPEGTGAMCKDIATKKLDIAIVLTEGAISDIINGGQHKIIATYCKQAISWGIFVKHNSKIDTISQLKGKTFGISRYGSGSHLIGQLVAHINHWQASKDYNMHIVNNLEGARQAFQQGQIDYFLWEEFTTKPLVDSGEWRMIDTFSPPWSSFVIVAHNDIIAHHKTALLDLTRLLRKASELFPTKINEQFIAAHYKLPITDVAKWYSLQQWETDNVISQQMLEEVQANLLRTQSINHTILPTQLCSNFCKIV